MIIPTTIQEALQIQTTEEAEAVLERMEELLSGKMESIDELPDDFDDKMAVYMLACTIDILNRLKTHPESPFGPDGWIGEIPEDELGEHG